VLVIEEMGMSLLTAMNWLGTGSSDHDNESPDFIKREEFFNQLSD
jgi:hypothetical protein